MFETKQILHYAVVISVLALVTYVGNQIKIKFAASDPDKDYMLVQKYLLNNTMNSTSCVAELVGIAKPKLWVHSKYEVNARKWLSFGSPNTNDLNQPYLHLTVKSILHHCGNDFDVLLIDDSCFSKLLPDWTIDMSRVNEPVKSHFRKIGLAMLVYRYGGMVVPNSFVCLRNLREMYVDGCANKQHAFCVEQHNRTSKRVDQKFLPGLLFFGGEAESPAIEFLIVFLQSMCKNGHLTDAPQFTGAIENWLDFAIRNEEFRLLDGGLVGIKTNKRERILIEDLMEERKIDLSPDCFGVYIDQDEILRRPCYKWFAVMSTHDIVQSSMILGKYIKRATADYLSEYGDGVERKRHEKDTTSISTGI